MTEPTPIATRLEAMAEWRQRSVNRLGTLGRFLQQHELLDSSDAAWLAAQRQQLDSDKLHVAFVAEFSRGKSELINAIFFADTGRRVLPATPGRTTMCPVELRHEPGRAPRLSLLPIRTRLEGASLQEWRLRDEAWQHLALQPGDAAQLADALAAVTQTERVPVAQARALGLWHDEQPDDNPPQGEDGLVEVPAWRHALIDYPHPLLAQGLVVLDTPGLNAIGAEPELTLGLLPAAHAVVFVLAADTGVTKSDLAVWRDHLGGVAPQRYVVLNKVDALADPLMSAEAVSAQVRQQCEAVSRTLAVPVERVFPMSARQALTARVEGDAEGLARSGLKALESALAHGLLPQRQQVLQQALTDTVTRLRQGAARRMQERRRQQAEQLLEMRGLQGKSGGKLRMMLERLDQEQAEFERCVSRLAALRAVQVRLQQAWQGALAVDRLRTELQTFAKAMGGLGGKLTARAAFDELISRLRTAVAEAAGHAQEQQQMLEAGFRQLNTDFGFGFALSPMPSLSPALHALNQLEQSHGHYLGLAQSWRLALPGFTEQFRRQLQAKLRVVFENAAGDLDLWSQGATHQLEAQLRDRSLGFARRREALQRVQTAAGDLAERIADVQRAEGETDALKAKVDLLFDGWFDAAASRSSFPAADARARRDAA